MTSVSALTALGPPEALAQPGGQAGAQAGYGVSLTDLSGFHDALAKAGEVLQPQTVSHPGAAMQALFRPLEHLNTEAASLSAHAKQAVEAGNSLTPGEMVMLSVRCHEFLFHSQLTANVANRTSDGLQQLFRQQS